MMHNKFEFAEIVGKYNVLIGFEYFQGSTNILLKIYL